MKHQLRISISKEPQTGEIVRCKNLSIRERILRHLLGEKQKLMALISGDSVESLSIKEIEGGMENEQNQTTARFCV